MSFLPDGREWKPQWHDYMACEGINTMQRKGSSSGYSKFTDDAASDEPVEYASERSNMSHTQVVTSKKEPRFSGKMNSSNSIGRLLPISVGSGFSKLKEPSQNAQTKKKKVKRDLKNGSAPNSSNSNGKHSEDIITKSREANFKYLRNSNASPFVKFLSKFTTPNPGSNA